MTKRTESSMNHESDAFGYLTAHCLPPSGGIVESLVRYRYKRRKAHDITCQLIDGEWVALPKSEDEQ